MALGALACASGCASDPEPAPQATADDNLSISLGPGITEVTLGLDPLTTTVSPAPGFDLTAHLCAPPADGTPLADNACKLTVDVLQSRIWLQSISWTEATFAGVLPIRADNLVLTLDGLSNPVSVGVGEGACVFEPTSSYAAVHTKAIPFTVTVELNSSAPPPPEGQSRSLADAVLDHLTIKLGITPEDVHACGQGCYAASSQTPTADCEAQDKQFSSVIAGALSGDLAELVRPMLHDAVAQRAH